jgi:hypothetical protein
MEYKHTLAVLRVISITNQEKDCSTAAALIKTGWWPTEYETVGTEVSLVSTESDDTLKVPKGCAEREEWISNTVECLAAAWRDGNRGYVHEELMRMPGAVAVAVTAGLGALLTDRAFYSGMMERA